MDTEGILNETYHQLGQQCTRLMHGLGHPTLELTWGYYGGHWHRRADGTFTMESYPIPVIRIGGLCDVEIGLHGVSVTAKLRREAALSASYAWLGGIPFEAYGVEDYLADYYHEGQTIEGLRENIRACTEGEIGFQFTFPGAVESAALLAFVMGLRREGFYY